jgi:hypothetical protein
MAEADAILTRAEQDAAADLLEPEGIQALRSLHGMCCRAGQWSIDGKNCDGDFTIAH